jgi:hypothetical protein
MPNVTITKGYSARANHAATFALFDIEDIAVEAWAAAKRGNDDSRYDPAGYEELDSLDMVSVSDSTGRLIALWEDGVGWTDETTGEAIESGRDMEVAIARHFEDHPEPVAPEPAPVIRERGYPEWLRAVEAQIIDAILDGIEGAGFAARVVDEEEGVMTAESRFDIEKDVAATDATTVMFWRPDAPGAFHEDHREGWVLLVHGNGCDVIADYSGNAATRAVLAKAEAVAEAFSADSHSAQDSLKWREALAFAHVLRDQPDDVKRAALRIGVYAPLGEE